MIGTLRVAPSRFKANYDRDPKSCIKSTARSKVNVTEHEKTRLMCTKYTCSNFARYLLLCICYDKFVSLTKFLVLFCLTDENYI